MKPICFYFEHIEDGRRCADTWGIRMWLHGSWEHPTNWLRRHEDTSKAERSGREPSTFIFAPTLPRLSIARCTWRTACGFSGAEMPDRLLFLLKGPSGTGSLFFRLVSSSLPSVTRQASTCTSCAQQASFAVGWAHGPGAPTATRTMAKCHGSDKPLGRLLGNRCNCKLFRGTWWLSVGPFGSHLCHVPAKTHLPALALLVMF